MPKPTQNKLPEKEKAKTNAFGKPLPPEGYYVPFDDPEPFILETKHGFTAEIQITVPDDPNPVIIEVNAAPLWGTLAREFSIEAFTLALKEHTSLWDVMYITWVAQDDEAFYEWTPPAAPALWHKKPEEPKAEPKAEPKSEPTATAPHWVMIDAERKSFWVSANNLARSVGHNKPNEQRHWIHSVLLGNPDGHIEDFSGSKNDALTKLAEAQKQALKDAARARQAPANNQPTEPDDAPEPPPADNQPDPQLFSLRERVKGLYKEAGEQEKSPELFLSDTGHDGILKAVDAIAVELQSEDFDTIADEIADRIGKGIAARKLAKQQPKPSAGKSTNQPAEHKAAAEITISDPDSNLPAVLNFDPNLGVRRAMAYNDTIKFLRSAVMKVDRHYGKIDKKNPNAKPSLLKPGAEMLCSTFRLCPKFRTESETINPDTGYIMYRIACDLYEVETGKMVASGVGSCNSFEVKYRYRWVQEWQLKDYGLKPADILPKHIKEYNGKKSYRVVNDEPFELVNTIDKMAQKRALIAAVLIATNASEFFTQDVETMRDFGYIDGEIVDDAA